MNKTEFLDKIEDLLNTVDKLPEGAEILSLFVDGRGVQLQVHDCIHLLWPYERVLKQWGLVNGFQKRDVSLCGVNVFQMDEPDGEDEDEADEDWPD